MHRGVPLTLCCPAVSEALLILVAVLEQRQISARSSIRMLQCGELLLQSVPESWSTRGTGTKQHNKDSDHIVFVDLYRSIFPLDILQYLAQTEITVQTWAWWILPIPSHPLPPQICPPTFSSPEFPHMTHTPPISSAHPLHGWIIHQRPSLLSLSPYFHACLAATKSLVCVSLNV